MVKRWTGGNKAMVKVWSGDGQEMVKKRALTSTRSARRPVDLQGLAHRRGALVADLVVSQTVTTQRKGSAHGQQMVKRWSQRWSRDGQGSCMSK
eukprot:2657084-Prymnesium_polylepis.1